MNYTYFKLAAYILKANYSGERIHKFTLHFGAEENTYERVKEKGKATKKYFHVDYNPIGSFIVNIFVVFFYFNLYFYILMFPFSAL